MLGYVKRPHSLGAQGHHYAGLQGQLERGLAQIRCDPNHKDKEPVLDVLPGRFGKDVHETGVAYSYDLIHWTEVLDHPVVRRRPGYFDAKVVEPGPPPIMTEQGIGICH